MQELASSEGDLLIRLRSLERMAPIDTARMSPMPQNCANTLPKYASVQHSLSASRQKGSGGPHSDAQRPLTFPHAFPHGPPPMPLLRSRRSRLDKVRRRPTPADAAERTPETNSVAKPQDAEITAPVDYSSH